MSEPPATLELSGVEESRWAEARRCFPVIQQLVKTPNRTRAHVVAAAAELGSSVTQVYEMLRRFLDNPRLTSLLHRQRGPIRGGVRLSAEINQLIDEAIETLYLTRQRPRLTDLVTQIRKRCREAGLTAPRRKAITARLNAKPRKEILARRRGYKAARDHYAPAIGSLEAEWPLALVQIDHTLVGRHCRGQPHARPDPAAVAHACHRCLHPLCRGLSLVPRGTIGNQRRTLHCARRAPEKPVACRT